MSIAELEREIQTLPEPYIAEVLDFVVFLKTKLKSKPKRKRFPKNPDNPSPSGDPWFDDPRNLAIVEEAIREYNKDKSKTVTAEESPVLREIFAQYR